jgi:hypothetical protein
MAEEIPSLHIDTDWKKQAQEEKRKLAEQEAKKAAEQAAPKAPPIGAGGGAAPGAAPSGAARSRSRDERELPPASISSLVQSIMTQVLFYLGELGSRGGGSGVNLDMAKHNVDLLGVLEEKTKGNLAPEEQQLLDTALYETRMRYVSVASQYIG